MDVEDRLRKVIGRTVGSDNRSQTVIASKVADKEMLLVPPVKEFRSHESQTRKRKVELASLRGVMVSRKQRRTMQGAIRAMEADMAYQQPERSINDSSCNTNDDDNNDDDNNNNDHGKKKKKSARKPGKTPRITYAEMLPVHDLWKSYISSVITPILKGGASTEDGPSSAKKKAKKESKGSGNERGSKNDDNDIEDDKNKNIKMNEEIPLVDKQGNAISAERAEILRLRRERGEQRKAERRAQGISLSIERKSTAALRAAEAILRADLHGSEIVVESSTCPALIGRGGLVFMETEQNFKVVDAANEERTIQKKGSVFSVAVADGVRVRIFGDSIAYRSSERSARKFKQRGSIELAFKHANARGGGRTRKSSRGRRRNAAMRNKKTAAK